MKSVHSAGVRTWRIDGARSAPGSAGMAGAPGARPRSIVNTLHHEHVHHSRRTGGTGPAPDRRISPSCASPSRCSQPECWPRPSSGRRAPRRRPRRPRRPPPTTPPGSTGCAAPSSVKAGPDSPDPIASWGVDGTAVASVVIGNVVYVGGTVQQRRVPDRPDRGARQPGRVLPGRRQRAEHLQRQLRRRPVNALATDGTNLFVGGNFTTLNGGAVNRLVKLNACPACATPASPRSPSRLRRRRRRRTAGWCPGPRLLRRDRCALRRW